MKEVEKFDTMYVDECQDLSIAKRKLVMLSLTEGVGRFVAVGDPKQAINGFAGAECDSFQKLAAMADIELPLSVCYRCAKSIIAAAQTIVPYIEAFEGAIEGSVNNVSNFDGLQAGDMIICRKTAPLVGLCLKLIANGKSAMVKGKDIAKGLEKLIDRMRAKDIFDLWEKLDKETEKIRKNAEKNGMKNPEHAPSVVAFKDKIETLKTISESCTSIPEIKDMLNKLFDDYNNRRVITLSTIHKAKGLEADRVWIIVPNKLPLMWKGQLEWQYEQEMNLKYVAYTRAKKCLNIVGLDEEQLAAYTFTK